MEDIVRASAFISLFIVMAFWEFIAPRRKQVLSRIKRWPANLILLIGNALLLRLLFAGGAYATAVWAGQNQYGLLNHVELPAVFSIVFAVVLLDILIYWQHRLFHVVPFLWRFHRVHHADQELDVSSGARFHPVEAVLSMLLKIVIVLLLGAPPEAVLIFELVLNLCATFNHSNIYIAPKLDKWIRAVLVTPDMHRIHHSTIRSECDSNYGFSVPWWDRLFGSYTDEPEMGQLQLNIGDKGVADQHMSRELGPMLFRIPIEKL